MVLSDSPRHGVESGRDWPVMPSSGRKRVKKTRQPEPCHFSGYNGVNRRVGTFGALKMTQFGLIGFSNLGFSNPG